jgi:hypothetical protein
MIMLYAVFSFFITSCIQHYIHALEVAMKFNNGQRTQVSKRVISTYSRH